MIFTLYFLFFHGIKVRDSNCNVASVKVWKRFASLLILITFILLYEISWRNELFCQRHKSNIMLFHFVYNLPPCVLPMLFLSNTFRTHMHKSTHVNIIHLHKKIKIDSCPICMVYFIYHVILTNFGYGFQHSKNRVKYVIHVFTVLALHDMLVMYFCFCLFSVMFCVLRRKSK